MKKLLLILTACICLFSCDKENKYNDLSIFEKCEHIAGTWDVEYTIFAGDTIFLDVCKEFREKLYIKTCDLNNEVFLTIEGDRLRDDSQPETVYFEFLDVQEDDFTFIGTTGFTTKYTRQK